MPETGLPRPIAVVGPTATGKTRLAEDLSLRLDGEIVTADSMQVYRGMDVGTAKIPLEARRVPHHCVDLVDPGEPFSAALYQDAARAVIDELRGRDVTPVVAGGTGLYVRAALDEMEFPAGELAADSRTQLEREAEQLGPAALHERLAELDPDSADLIHPNNVRRTIRALEMVEQGISYAEQAAGFSDRRPCYETLYLGLDMERERLYERIDSRVDGMLGAGLLDEIAGLLASGWRDALTSAQAIGYKEFVPVVENGADMGQAASDVKQATRRYAKRQLTWFRGDPRVQWVDVTETSPDQVLDVALQLVESSEHTD